MFAMGTDGGQGIAEFLVVCEKAISLDGKAEVGRGRIAPALECLLALQAIEVRVYFSRVKTLGAEAKPVILAIPS